MGVITWLNQLSAALRRQAAREERKQMLSVTLPLITPSWVKANCRCVRQDKVRPHRLLCQESCPLHASHVEYPTGGRDRLEEVTAELGWELHWARQQAK